MDFRDILKDLTEAAVSGASGGFMDEMSGVLNEAIGDVGLAPDLGPRQAERGLNGRIMTMQEERAADYNEGRRNVREDDAQRAERSPVTNFVGQVVGSIPAGVALAATGLGPAGAGVVQGTAAGLGHSQAEDAMGMSRDALLGGGTGGFMALAGDMAGSALRNLAGRFSSAARPLADSLRVESPGMPLAEVPPGQMGQTANAIRSANVGGVGQNPQLAAMRANAAAGPLPEVTPPPVRSNMRPPIPFEPDAPPPVEPPGQPLGELFPEVPVREPGPSPIQAQTPSTPYVPVTPMEGPVFDQSAVLRRVAEHLQQAPRMSAPSEMSATSVRGLARKAAQSIDPGRPTVRAALMDALVGTSDNLSQPGSVPTVMGAAPNTPPMPGQGVVDKPVAPASPNTPPMPPAPETRRPQTAGAPTAGKDEFMQMLSQEDKDFYDMLESL